MWCERRCGTRRMNRTQTQSVANPATAVTSAATPSMAAGDAKRAPSKAPTHIPRYDAPHASAGVASQPTTTTRWASQRGIPTARALALARDARDSEHGQRERVAGADHHGQGQREAGEPSHDRHDHGARDERGSEVG